MSFAAFYIFWFGGSIEEKVYLTTQHITGL